MGRLANSRMHLTKEEKEIRSQVESLGCELSSKIPNCLTNDQKEIYKTLFESLKETGMLKVLDTEVMINAAVIIDRLHKIDDAIDSNESSMLYDKEMSMLRARYFQQFLGICKELCLSPAARAKMGTLMLNNHKKEKDDLMDVLAGDSE